MSNTLTEEELMATVTAASRVPLLDYSGEVHREQTRSPTSPLTNIPSMIQDLMEFYCFERQSSPDYLVLLHIASFGKQGSGLGSDESHVAMLTAKIFDIQERSVNGAEWQTSIRMPDSNSRSYSPDGSSESVNISSREEICVSEECYAFTGLQLSDVTKAPSLWEALETLDNWIITQGLFYSTNGTKESNFELAVDGGTGLRLVLHQSLDYPIEKTYRRFPYLCQFIDIKKAFMLLYWKIDSPFTIIDMLQSLNLQIPDYPSSFSPEAATWVTSTANQMVTTDAMPTSCDTLGHKTMSEYPQFGYWPLVYCRTMANLCGRMTSDGIHFVTLLRSSDNVPDDVVVRARGLPWQATNVEVKHFFRGLNIAPGGIALVLSKAGRRNGEAVIRFTTREQRELALKKHKHHMNQRYIEIYAANSAEFIAVAGGKFAFITLLVIAINLQKIFALTWK
nr:epithelial splicing regulatory protein 1 [Hymenolepis microstoma]